MNKSASNNLRAVIRQLISRSASIGTTVQVGASLGALMLAASVARADDVTCSYTQNGDGTQSCAALVSGTSAADQTTWDKDGNGHNGGAGGPSDSNTFNLTDSPATPVSTVDVRATGGKGGDGYHANPADLGFNKTGGNGGSGGQAGDIGVTLGSAISVISNTAGIDALSIVSQGGAGGKSGQGSFTSGTSGTAGVGGSGGSVTATVDGNWRGTDNSRSAFVSSQGGAGGAGGSYDTGLSFNGGDAAVGGNAGTVTLSLLNSQGGTDNQFAGGAGILAQSIGGVGGQGGNGDSADGSEGGAGGKGGNAGTVTVTVGSNVQISAGADDNAGLHLLSQGGAGGVGGKGGSGGASGAVAVPLMSVPFCRVQTSSVVDSTLLACWPNHSAVTAVMEERRASML